MKRRTNRKTIRQRKRSSELMFSIVRLESRQMLAGDLVAAPSNFAISLNEEVRWTSDEVVAEETCVEEKSKTKDSVTCDQRNGNLRLAIGDRFLFTQSAGYSFDPDSEFYSRGTTGNSTSDGNFTTDNDALNDVEETIPIPVTEPTPISSPAEELPIETPEKGTYYKSILREESASDRTEDLGVKSRSKDSRIDMLGEQQMFALIPPSVATSETFGILAKPTFGPHASHNSVAQSLQQIDTAFSSLDHRFKHRYLENSSLYEQRQNNQTVPSDFSLDFLSDHVREFGASFESSDDSTDARIERSDFERELDSSFTFFETADSPADDEVEVIDVKEQPPLRPAESKEDSAADQSLSRKVQMVESAILLIGLRGSRIGRNDNEVENDLY